MSIDRDLNVNIIAKTLDDAAGEAMDKGAKLLGLSYPGGPEIEKFSKSGNHNKFNFPQAFQKKEDMYFSFSGLKTSLRYFLEKFNKIELEENFSDICASYQFAVVDILSKKMKQVLLKEKFNSISLSGGVANNTLLRENIIALGQEFELPVYIPEPKYTGDNSSMIAFAAYVDQNHTSLNVDFLPNLTL